jgi:two-component system nitrogen regulation sensor histidine kinase GlnL
MNMVAQPPAAALPLQSLLDAIPNPLIAIDQAESLCFANVAAEDFFQLSRAQLVRHRLAELVPAASPVFHSLAEVRKSGGYVSEYGVTVGTPRSGGERIVDLQVAPLTDEPGHLLVMLLPRSMALKFDQQLTHRGAARSVSGMASMLAHEIKNPLAGIRGAAQLLEPALGDEDRVLARLICDETDRIRDLVDQMEIFSDERPVETRPVNIHAVLGRVKLLSDAAAHHNIAIREEYDPSLPPVVGNQDQLIQVFLNLVKNAVEAIERDAGSGEIVLTTAFRPGVRLSMPGAQERISLPLEVCIHDNGPGIPEDLRPHIFEPFVTAKPGGKGLGLALVAKIVRDHGGVVECQARERGTTFRVLLPMMKEHAAATAAADRGIEP